MSKRCKPVCVLHARLATSLVERDGLCERNWAANCPDGMQPLAFSEAIAHYSMSSHCVGARMGSCWSRLVCSASILRRCVFATRVHYLMCCMHKATSKGACKRVQSFMSKSDAEKQELAVECKAPWFALLRCAWHCSLVF